MTAIATAIARPSGMVASAMRSAWRPPATKASSTLTTGTTSASTSRNAPVVVTVSAGYGIRGRWGRCPRPSTRVHRVAQRRRAGGLEQPQQQRDRQRRRGKGHDDTRDDQRLRHRIAAEACRRTPAGDDAEEQEHAAAEQIESENLAERLGIRDQAVEPEPHRHRCAQPEHRRGAHHQALRSGAPASSRPSVTAIVSVIATSIVTISGLAYAMG